MRIKSILEKIFKVNKNHWSIWLDDALWEYRTIYKISIGMSQFRLVYGKTCHLPLELQHKVFRVVKQWNSNMIEASSNHKLKLQELKEIRNDVHESARIYKEKTKAFHDKSISQKNFKAEQKVLLFYYLLKSFSRKPVCSNKVISSWSVWIQSMETRKIFKVNGHKLKSFYKGLKPRNGENMILKIPKIDAWRQESLA